MDVRTWLLAGFLFGAGGWSVALAGEAPREEEEPAAEPGSAFSFTLLTLLSHEYVAQGMVFEKKGVVAQPWATLYLTLTEGVDIFVGGFASFHSAHTDAGLLDPPDATPRLRSVYEADWLAGVSLTHERWNLYSYYGAYYSPSDAWETASSLDVILTYSDLGLLAEKLSLDPYGYFYWEVDGKSGTGIDEGYYFQAGLKPSHPLEVLGHEILMTTPVSAGFGWSDFYANDETFGYVSGSVAPVVPLNPWIPVEYGLWSITPAVTFFHLNEAVQYLNADGNRFVGTATLSLAF